MIGAIPQVSRLALNDETNKWKRQHEAALHEIQGGMPGL